jgi:hypothetical protein
MDEEHARSFAGGASSTTLSPIVAGMLALAIVLVLILPRKKVLYPLFTIMFMVPLGQQLYLAGVHLYVFRIIILVGLARAIFARLSEQETILSGGSNSIDSTFVWCALCQVFAVTVLFHTGNAVINQVGSLLDFVGGYLVIRYLIRDMDDVYRSIKCLAVLAIIFGLSMVVENRTMRNPFGYIGAQAAPDLREGRARSMGPFNHELMAGSFGATLIPLCVLLWKNTSAKVTAALGLVGGTLMAITSNSSTSLLTLGAAIMAIMLWPLRKSMRMIRWGIVVSLILLQLVMKAPVWFVIAHIDLTGGSSSYHRAALIDQFIRHFSDWCVIGVRQSGTWGLDMWDAQNQYVNVGETGGLIALILFVAMISICFSKLGDARKAVGSDKKQEWVIWLLGATMFANVIAFFGVNYFDQMKFAWFALLAMISAVTVPILQAQDVTVPETGLRGGKASLAYSSGLKRPSMAMRPGPQVRAQLKSKST